MPARQCTASVTPNPIMPPPSLIPSYLADPVSLLQFPPPRSGGAPWFQKLNVSARSKPGRTSALALNDIRQLRRPSDFRPTRTSPVRAVHEDGHDPAAVPKLIQQRLGQILDPAEDQDGVIGARLGMSRRPAVRSRRRHCRSPDRTGSLRPPRRGFVHLDRDHRIDDMRQKRRAVAKPAADLQHDIGGLEVGCVEHLGDRARIEQNPPGAISIGPPT
jgi:hypothetical protein